MSQIYHIGRGNSNGGFIDMRPPASPSYGAYLYVALGAAVILLAGALFYFRQRKKF